MSVKKRKCKKTYVIKSKFKFENYVNCLEATQLDNKINYLEKNEINIKKDHKEVIRKNKLVFKKQLRFNSKKHNVYTEEIN